MPKCIDDVKSSLNDHKTEAKKNVLKNFWKVGRRMGQKQKIAGTTGLGRMITQHDSRWKSGIKQQP